MGKKKGKGGRGQGDGSQGSPAPGPSQQGAQGGQEQQQSGGRGRGRGHSQKQPGPAGVQGQQLQSQETPGQQQQHSQGGKGQQQQQQQQQRPPSGMQGPRPGQQQPPPGVQGPRPGQQQPPPGVQGATASQQQTFSKWGPKAAQQQQQQGATASQQQSTASQQQTFSKWGPKAAQQQQQGPRPGQQQPPAGVQGPRPGQQQPPPGMQGPPPGQQQQQQHQPPVGMPGQQPRQQQQQQQHRGQQQRRGPPQGEQTVQQQRPPPETQATPPSKQQPPLAPANVGQGDAGRRAQEVAEITEHIQSLAFRPAERKAIVPGRMGRPIALESNHITINLGKLRFIHHYDVNIVPDMPKRFLRHVFELFRRTFFPNNYPAFDGKKSMYSSKLMPVGDSQTFSGTVTYKDDNDQGKEYKVDIMKVATVDLTPLINLTETVYSPTDALQAINVVLKSAPARNCIPVGNSFFQKPGQIIDLGNGMEMYHGFYQSAIRGGKLLLNVDVAHKAFPSPLNCIDAIVEVCSNYYNRLNRDSLKRPLDPRDLEPFRKFITTLRVVYQIPGQASSKRTYSVNGLGGSARKEKFKLDNGPEMTIFDYFKNQKRYPLMYPDMPTLWVGSRTKRILVPVECCTIVEGQAIKRSMNENQTSAMIKQAATNTDVRKQKIMNGLRQANYNAEPTIREFGISVGNQFESLSGRVLPPPRLGYASNKMAMPQKGVWRSERFFQGATINSWTIAYADRREPQNLRILADMIYKQAAQNGLNINAKATEPFYSTGFNEKDIGSFFSRNSKFDIIFVVVPNSGPQYSYVKTAAEVNVGCLTQCIKMRTLNKLNPQTVGNILLKVNSKLKGVNHVFCERPPIMDRPCMIMGADVTHPSPESTHIPSVAAVVASHDPKAFRYNICWRLQDPKTEIIRDLKEIVYEQLLYFYRSNNSMRPERIVFFRDGVSDGQFDEVREKEIRAIHDACRMVQKDGEYRPTITFVIVQKRHHTRLFPKNKQDSEDRNCNVPAGTCVDHTIVNPCMQNFYLVSHASIQGVAKPTKYCTIWDDNNFSNDDIEQLAYYLCHMFTRCTRSVSYPAPTYYAHLAAARGKVYIENEINMDLNRLAETQRRYTIRDSVRKELPMFFV